MTGFLHYFYVPAPIGFRKESLSDLTNAIQQSFPNSIHHLEIAMKESLWGYSGNVQSPFIKVVVNDPRSISKVRTGFERGSISYEGFNIGMTTSFDNIAYVLRAMVDCHITGMSWITLPAGKYVHVTNKISTSQLEVSIDHADLATHESEGEWLKVAPLRVLSFDIECAGRKGIFPEPEKDPIIQIANVVSRQGDARPFVRNVFTVDTCSPIVGTQIFEHAKERDMLSRWRDFIREVDPDVIIGYNRYKLSFTLFIRPSKDAWSA